MGGKAERRKGVNGTVVWAGILSFWMRLGFVLIDKRRLVSVNLTRPD